jgi:hypothetical protein
MEKVRAVKVTVKGSGPFEVTFEAPPRRPDGIRVKMPDGSTFRVRKLLTDDNHNAKLHKSALSGKGWMTRGLCLAPAKTSGYNVCPNATPGCTASCIYHAGYAGVFDKIKTARIAKTRAWFQQREAFHALLFSELWKAERKALRRGQRLAVRLNVFSDIAWERVWPELFEQFPEVQFYDYTKSAARALAHAKRDFPPNYHLTFSRSESNEAECLQVLAAGGNVSVVFDHKELPDVWNCYRVIDGDETDLRLLDPKGVVVGLCAKGAGKRDETGFVVQTPRLALPLF